MKRNYRKCNWAIIWMHKYSVTQNELYRINPVLCLEFRNQDSLWLWLFIFDNKDWGFMTFLKLFFLNNYWLIFWITVVYINTLKTSLDFNFNLNFKLLNSMHDAWININIKIKRSCQLTASLCLLVNL